MMDHTEKGLAALGSALLTWLLGQKAVAGWKFFFGGGKSLIDATNARRKIAADVQVAEDTLKANADIAHEKLMAEARAAAEQRLSDGQWRILEEQRKLNETTNSTVATLKSRMDDLDGRLTVSEEKRQFSEIAADVAHIRADDLDKEMRKALAEHSVLRVEIATLSRQLDEAAEENRLGREENRELIERIFNLQAQFDQATKKIELMENAIKKNA